MATERLRQPDPTLDPLMPAALVPLCRRLSLASLSTEQRIQRVPGWEGRKTPSRALPSGIPTASPSQRQNSTKTYGVEAKSLWDKLGRGAVSRGAEDLGVLTAARYCTVGTGAALTGGDEEGLQVPVCGRKQSSLFWGLQG